MNQTNQSAIDPDKPIPYEIVDPEKPVSGMLLHCGARLVDRPALFEVPTPKGTDTWYPLAHRALLEEVGAQLDKCGFSIGRESHALSHDGARYFGVVEVKLPDQTERDYAWIVGRVGIFLSHHGESWVMTEHHPPGFLFPGDLFQ